MLKYESAIYYWCIVYVEEFTIEQTKTFMMIQAESHSYRDYYNSLKQYFSFLICWFVGRTEDNRSIGLDRSMSSSNVII